MWSQWGAASFLSHSGHEITRAVLPSFLTLAANVPPARWPAAYPLPRPASATPWCPPLRLRQTTSPPPRYGVAPSTAHRAMADLTAAGDVHVTRGGM
jgi:hypothetical protein